MGRRVLVCLVLTCIMMIPAASAPAADNSPPEGFTSLFNGKDLSGWKVPEGDNGHWRVVDGVIDYDAQSEAKGDKNLWTEREFVDFELHVEWRIKEAPWVNPNVMYILPDGTTARDITGKPLRLPLPDSDSGVFLRGSGRHQLNIWCWPIGSGEMYGLRTRSPDVPRTACRRHAANAGGQAGRRVESLSRHGRREYRHGRPQREDRHCGGDDSRSASPRRVALQHHGGKRGGEWNSPPSLVQFKKHLHQAAG